MGALLMGQNSCGILTRRINGCAADGSAFHTDNIMGVLLTGQHSCGILTHRIRVDFVQGAFVSG